MEEYTRKRRENIKSCYKKKKEENKSWEKKAKEARRESEIWKIINRERKGRKRINEEIRMGGILCGIT